ncbi:MAG: hypothetical protein L0Y55_01170, partial [Anaerolineales bacterium]|nr:hypothetical protein [Anaerolineales bacterium]
NDFARLKGQGKEMHYQMRGVTIFGRILRKGRDASSLVVEQLHQAVEQGQLSEEEKNDVLAADLFWSGEFQKKPVLLVGEISWVVDNEDVERAVRRAARLRQIGFNAAPFVGGEEWTSDATALAKSLAVLIAEDGRMDLINWHTILQQNETSRQ